MKSGLKTMAIFKRSWTSAERSLARAEFDRLLIANDVLEALCIAEAGEFLPLRAQAAPIIAERIIDCIRDEIPLSLVRIGDGEGNALAVAGPQVGALHVKTFKAKFLGMTGASLREDEAIAFCTTMKDVLVSADIIGFRSVDRIRINKELDVIRSDIERGEIVPAIGMLYAREFLRGMLARGELRSKTLTSAWIHLALMPHLAEIMEAAKSVVVITGRSTLKRPFESRLGGRLRAFISVPPERVRFALRNPSHYRSAFPRILDALNTDLRGTLVLVGAGLFGKAYCAAAKKSGAIALDLGSVFDILAGVPTRHIHAQFDIEKLRWA